MGLVTLLSGFDVRQVPFPDGTEVLEPPVTLPALDGFAKAAARALEQPVSGPPLRALLSPHSRVTVVIDDGSYPSPPPKRDARIDMVDAVADVLKSVGVPPARVRYVLGTGTRRRLRPKEVSEWLGERAAAFDVFWHDAEADMHCVPLTHASEGTSVVSRALVECDLIIHLTLVCAPHQTGLFQLVDGCVSGATARRLNATTLFEGETSPLLPDSAWSKAHQAVGQALLKQVPVFQVAAVLNNALWPRTVANLFSSTEALTRPLQMWNSLPEPVRHRTSRLMRTGARPLGVWAGPPDAVAGPAREAFLRQHEVEATGPADVLVVGVPDLGPFTKGTGQNPLLALHLGLGVLAQSITDAALVRQGGVVVLANPLLPRFDVPTHQPYFDFYEQCLRDEREPAALSARFEQRFVTEPRAIDAYRRREAFHPSHPFATWNATWPLRRWAGRIFAAHADPRVCARFGISAAHDVERALEKAANFLRNDKPRVRVLGTTPPFAVKVRS